MLLMKSVILLISILTISFPGLIIITTSFVPTQISSGAPEDLSLKEKNFSKSFYQIEHSLRNEEYDKIAIPKKIEDLTSKFEREYLQSLIKKRNDDFSAQYNLLVWQLSYVPEFFRYYDELVFAARANNKLAELNEQTARIKTRNGFKVYLKALIEYSLGNYENSLKSLDALTAQTKETFFLKARVLRGLGDYENAYFELNESEKLAQANADYLPGIYNSKGSLLFLSGEYKKSEELYRKANLTAKSTRNREEEARSLVNLGIIADNAGDVGSARSLFRQSLDIAGRIQNPELKAFAYSELGVSFSLTNEIIEAKSNYEKSYQLYTKLNNEERLSYLSSNIASIYSQLSNFRAALKYYEEGLSLAKENKRGRILSLIGIGDVYANLSNYSKALEYYELAKKISGEIKDALSSAAIDVSIGTLLYNIGRPHKAIEFYKKASDIIGAETNPYDAADLYFKTGLAYSDIDSLELSTKYYSEGLALSRASGDLYNEIIISTELGHNYYLMNDFKQAEERIAGIRKLSGKYGLTQLTNVQDLYLAKIFIDRNETEKAAELLNRVLNNSTSISDYNTQIEAGYILARLSEAEQRFSDARKYYDLTIQLIEELSLPLFNNPEVQIFRFSSVDDVFSSYAEFLYEHGDTKEAFELVERSRSRNTLQNLNNIKITSAIKDETLLNKLYDLDWIIKSGLYSGNVLSNYKSEYDTLKSFIISKTPSVEKYLNNLFGKGNKDYQKKLKPGENIISMNIGDKTTQVFLLSGNRFSSKRINLGRNEIKNFIADVAPIYSEDMNDEGIYFNQDLFSFNAKASYLIYKSIFEPVLSEIPKGEHVVFNLPPELSFFPAEFLVTEYSEDESPYFYKDKKFLVEDYLISYTPSVSVYFFKRDTEKTDNRQILLVGDPIFNNKDFSLSYRGGLLEDDSFNSRNIALFPLQYSKEEISTLNDLVEDGLVLTSDVATESNFKEKAEVSKVIHLSTHSFLYKDQPLILFSSSGDKENDGFLESTEILELDLSSELVVLSSCRSGLGRIDRSEGVLGMQKSFFEAGAKSIVVSLWDVNDKYTSYFMKSFYKFLADGDNKAAALRKAKLYFKEKYSSNPYYWSAFVLAGDVSGISLTKASGSSTLLLLLTMAMITVIAFIIIRKRKI